MSGKIKLCENKLILFGILTNTWNAKNIKDDMTLLTYFC